MSKSNKKRVLLVGGGSGGHLVPLLPVAQELKGLQPTLDIRVYCDNKTHQLACDLFVADEQIRVEKIVAGKIRRYHHLKWWQHLDLSILLPNLLDLIKTVLGFIQACFKMLIWRPKLVFCKGGYVALPVGLAAKLLGIKIIIHDSDTMPGLTNRILAKFALKIATGFAIENYPSYPSNKIVHTGIPIKASYRPVNKTEKLRLRQSLGLSSTSPLILAMGGGLGARPINQISLELARHRPDWQVVLATGVGAGLDQKTDTILPNLRMQAFFQNIDQYVLASDVVICRAGATTLTELVASHKNILVVPNPRLAGGHQLKNAATLAKDDIVQVIQEADLNLMNLNTVLESMLSSVNGVAPSKARVLSFDTVIKLNAAENIAKLILAEI